MSDFFDRDDLSWEEVGLYFGYPKCCIEEFCNGEPNFITTLEDMRLFCGTGFVPCKKCNETKTEDQLLAEIAKNRKYDKPFPLDRHDKEVAIKDVKKFIAKRRKWVEDRIRRRCE